MAVSKFRIYDYWKDKAITKKFEIKPVSACTKEDDALSITEFPDEIFCWACQMPPYQQGTHRTLSGLWNGDTLLQRSHILEKSLNGEDKPENYFLLCPQCHAESPDTTDAKLFFAWVRYKRTHENYSMVLRRDMKKAAEILGVDQNLVEERFAALRLTRLEEDAYIRDYIVKNCAMHGSFLAPLSRMMIHFIRSEATAALSIALMPFFSETLVLMPLPMGFTSFPGRGRPYSSSSLATTTIRPLVREYSQVERVMS